MAEYKQGDRVVKMSGIGAGKYGTVNSVREDGTLNVTFDGERLSRFCDPERCGKVAANAIKIGAYGLPDVHPGQKVRVVAPGFRDTGKVLTVERVGDGFGGRIVAGGFAYKPQDLEVANSRVAKAKDAFGAEIKVGDTVKFATGTFRGLIGEVVKIDGARAIVRTNEYGDVTEDLKVIRVYNSRVRAANGWPNARMKFKAGDKVRHRTNGLDGVVEGWASDPGQYRVRASGRVYEWDEDDLVLARNAVSRNTDYLQQSKGEIVEDQWRIKLERAKKGTYREHPMRYRDFENILPTLRKWETADVTTDLRQKFRRLNGEIAEWMRAHADEKR